MPPSRPKVRFVSGRDPFAQALEADLLDQQPQEVLVRQPLLVAQPLSGEVLVDLRAVFGAGVEAFLALALGALAGGADVHHHLRPLDLLG
jgi:hypothetical protein